MSLFDTLLSPANAQTTTAAASDPMTSAMGFLPIVLMFVVMYFLMIRPQMKKAKEHKALVEALQKGDEVITQGGIAGRIVKVGENYVTVEVAPNVEIAVQKAAVGNVLPKGTLKSL